MIDDVSIAAYIVCPWCDEEKCVGRYNCKQIEDYIKNIKERREENAAD